MAKYIEFEKRGKFIAILNKRSRAVLGHIAWFPKWKCYIFSQYEQDSIFSSGCLRDIANECDRLLTARIET